MPKLSLSVTNSLTLTTLHFGLCTFHLRLLLCRFASLFYINSMKKPNLIVLASSIRSIYNVGSIFRTADALGVEKLYLIGGTATPVTQPNRLPKTSLGAEKSVPWEYAPTVFPILRKLKKAGYEIIALEEGTTGSLDYRKWRPASKIALVLGNEAAGLAPRLLRSCSLTIALPMLGAKNSLNVATAFSAIGYYILSAVT